MSRLGKLPIKIPQGCEARIDKNAIIVKGPKGELTQALSKIVKVEVLGNEIKLNIENKSDKKEKAFWGLYWSLISNMVKGVIEGFEVKLEIIGVGYKAALSGQKLVLNVGYSHPVDFILPNGISGLVAGNVITISGADKQLVGEMAAQIRKIRKPEPYKGKGIKYVSEFIKKKEGKTAGK